MHESEHDRASKQLKRIHINEKILIVGIIIVIAGFILANVNVLPPLHTLSQTPVKTIELLTGETECLDRVLVGGKAIVVEIADDREELLQGLMFRRNLPADYGMLFIFDRPYKYSFWMQNMQIPLDIIFISEDLKVIQVFEVPPCKTEPCPTYQPEEAAKYVLEVNRGFSQTNAINPGSSVNLSLCGDRKTFNT